MFVNHRLWWFLTVPSTLGKGYDGYRSIHWARTHEVKNLAWLLLQTQNYASTDVGIHRHTPRAIHFATSKDMRIRLHNPSIWIMQCRMCFEGTQSLVFSSP